tara:strand:- start:10702 stop:11583 length:882 start_codon:yes stop_codon:yes gene_type:complete
MILKKGSKGKEVKELQEFLDILSDGDFGPGTEKAVKKWQSDNKLVADGIVGPKTWDAMGLASTDNRESIYTTSNGLTIEKYFLPKGEYKTGPTNKEYLFLHHTAGWNNPYRCIDHWGRDTRGAIATEFVLGGQSVKGNDDKYDGTMLQCIPEGGYGWHLGKNGSQYMHTHSVGIEICNFGYIVNGKTYAGTSVVPEQIVKLDKPFRGKQEWHKYSEAQIEATRKWILYIAERDNIDVRSGLVSEIKKRGVEAFDFNDDAYYGRVKGMWTHTNTRKGKTDLFPQQELIDMLLSL